MRTSTFTERSFYAWVVVVTVAIEAATIATRLATGVTAAEFNVSVDPPLLVKMHRMFWATPLIGAGVFVRGKRAS